MTKYCKNCGSELEEDSFFCNECGTKLGQNMPLSSSISQDNPFRSYKIDMIAGENVIKSSNIHIGCLFLPLFVTVIGLFLLIFLVVPFLILIILGLAWLLIRFLGYSNNDLILTNKRVFGKCGLISTTQMQSPLNKIDSVSYSNGLIGKIIGYGTVEIATTSSHFKFRFIREGQSLYNDIFNQLERSEREKILENAKAVADALSG